MLTVFLSFAATDSAIAETIAARLEGAAEVRVLLDSIPDQTLHTAWEGGGASAGVVLLLSPASVPERLTRNDWAGLLSHINANAEPPVISVLIRPCRFPPLLERNRFLLWDEAGEALHALQRWAMSLHPADGGGFAPAHQPYYAGRDAELKYLRTSLVDRPGVVVIAGAPGSGKTSLAQEFALRDQAFFRKVAWVSCRGRSTPCIVNDLASQLGLKSSRATADSISSVFDEHRVLAVLDQLENTNLVHKLRGGAASVLITRSQPLPGENTLELDAMTTAAADLPGSSEQQALWEAMTVCRADQLPVQLAAAIAEVPMQRAADACRGLSERRLIDPLDEASGSWRLNSAAPMIQSRELELRRRHASWVSRALATNIVEAKAAFDWACAADWETAAPLGKQIFSFLKGEGRSEEASSVLEKLQAAAVARGDSKTVEFARYELSWISGSQWIYPGAAAGVEQLGFDFGAELT
jgi:hypothetical protein